MSAFTEREQYQVALSDREQGNVFKTYSELNIGSFKWLVLPNASNSERSEIKAKAVFSSLMK